MHARLNRSTEKPASTVAGNSQAARGAVHALAMDLVREKPQEAVEALLDQALAWLGSAGDKGFQIDFILRLGCERAIEQARREAANKARTDAPDHSVRGAQRQPERRPAPATEKAEGSPWTPPANTGAGLAGRLEMVAPGYDWTLPNGAQLLEAGVADLENAIAAHAVKARAHTGLVKLYATLKAKMQKEHAHRVGDLFSSDQIAQLRIEHGITGDE
jgi:hypothetical protein